VAEPRILHINDQDAWGGGEGQTWLLVRELEALGLENHALVRRGSELERRLRPLLPPARLHLLPGALWPLAALKVRGLRSAVDVVHAHTGRATQALAGAGALPTVAHRRIPDTPGPSGLRRLGAASLVLCVSEEIRRRLRSLTWPGGRVPRLETVHSAALWPEERPAPMPLEGAPVLGFMGHFRHHKGLDLVLQALPRLLVDHPGLVLHLAGEGAEELPLRRLSRQEGLEGAVRFHTLPSQPAAFLGALNLFVMPSREEGLGSVALLAQALGVPVLATRAGGIPEGVRHGETGWLVEPGSADALVEGLHLLLGDGVLRKRLGAAGPAWVRGTFAPRAMATRTLDLYKELVAAPTTPTGSAR